MLILTRKTGESLIVGDNEMEIKVMSVTLNNLEAEVKIGINAPEELSIHRQELYNRIKKNKNGNHRRPILSKKDDKIR